MNDINLPDSKRNPSLRSILGGITTLLYICFTAAPALANTSKWNIDPEASFITFRLRSLPYHLCEGTFSRIAGNAQYDPDAIENSSVKAFITIATIDTNLKARDENLKKKDFFDVEKFPAARFESHKIIAGQGNDFKIEGELFMHGLSHEVVLDATKISEAPDEMKLRAKTVLKRSDYKLGSGPKSLTITDGVDIEMSMHLLRAVVFKHALPQ